jgi:molecular chaperone DnaK (HSP70)
VKSGIPQVRVEFSVDRTCTITARAILEGSKHSSEQVFAPPQELSESFIAKILADAELSRKDEESEVRQIEATNRANRLILEFRDE